jgi:HK97 family phage major capsid protein
MKATTTNVYLKTKIEERTSQAAVLDNLQKTAAEAARDLTDDERKTYDSIVGRLQFLDEEIKRISDAEAGAAKFAEVYGAHQAALAKAEAARQAAEAEAARRTPEERAARKSWGTRFVESAEFKAYNGHGASAAFEISGDFLGIEERQAFSFGPGENIMAANMEGLQSQWWSGPTEAAFRTPLFDVIGRVPTTMGSIEYMYWEPGDEDNMASEVPEGTVKPEASLAGELKAVPISTYAWWKGITRQALDDIPQIRAIVDTFLRRGVIRKINAEAGTELTSDANIAVIGGAGTELLAVIRAGIAQVDTNGYGVNAVLLNPMDWAALDMELLRLTGAGTDIQSMFWGLRPVALPGLPTGTAYVGDFREAVTFFDRQSTQVLLSDSHAEYFLRNKVVLLAEARGKVAVTNAAAVVKCTGDVPSITLANGGGNGGTGLSARRRVPARPAAAE